MTSLSLVGYHLSYDDEFSSPSLFSTSSDGTIGYRNDFSYGRTLYSNNEAEYYIDPALGSTPFSVANGALTITAQPAVPGQDTSGLPYASGMISTENSFSQNQGYFEIRAQTPDVHGFWAAFWMLPTTDAGFPELDALEQPNLEGNNAYWTYANLGDQNKGGGFNDTGTDLSAGYHTYGLMWTATTITFYLDDLQIGPTVAVPAGFTQKMFMIANLAVGGAGSWPGQPVGTLTAQYNIDYIRAYSADPLVPAVALQPISSPDGVDTTPSYLAPGPIVPVPVGLGADLLVLTISEDNWQGDAQFTISIDGVQQGGVQTATASHAAGASQAFQVHGSFGTTLHTVTVDFLNDANGGLASIDRNLYVVGATLNGTVIVGGVLTENLDGPQSFSFLGNMALPAPLPAVTVTAKGTTTDTISVIVAEIPGLANVQFTISIDGVQQGGVLTATALASASQTQAFLINGSFAAGTHSVSVQMVEGTVPNGGTLQVAGATLNGTALAGSTFAETTSVPQSFSFIEPVPVLPVSSVTAVAGTGPDVLTFGVSEDAWQGDAQFTISIDGVQQGGIQTATAAHATGQIQSFQVLGVFSTGPHSATVTFLNDAYGGSAQTDRNLYVVQTLLNGTIVAGGMLNEYSGGPASFSFTGTTVVPPPPAAVTVTAKAANTDVLTLLMAEIPGQTDAAFTISVDGVQQGGIQTTTALANLNQTQAFVVNGSFAAGPHSVSIAFINPVGGTAALTAAGLSLQSATLNGAAIVGGVLTEATGTAQSFTFTEPVASLPPATQTLSIGTGTDHILLGVNEDAYQGDAKFTVAVDGIQQGGTLTATASHAAGQSQIFQLNGTFGTGQHSVAVTFLNDAYGGSAQTDRNLYVSSLSYNGVESPVDQAALMSAGTATLAVSGGVSHDSVTFLLTEDAYNGDAQVALSLDGHLLGTTTVQFLNSGKIAQAFTYTGDFGGSAIAHVATVDFLNDAYGGSATTDRNVYVQSIAFDGTTPSGFVPTALLSGGPVSFMLPLSH
jgi:hypothetical protein